MNAKITRTMTGVELEQQRIRSWNLTEATGNGNGWYNLLMWDAKLGILRMGQKKMSGSTYENQEGVIYPPTTPPCPSGTRRVREKTATSSHTCVLPPHFQIHTVLSHLPLHLGHHYLIHQKLSKRSEYIQNPLIHHKYFLKYHIDSVPI